MRFFLLASFAVTCLSSTSALAQSEDCGCDHVVAPDVLSIDGDDLGAGPGDVICIEAGDREFLRIYDMSGSVEAPITIKNCGGQVVIDNADRGYGLTLDGSSHVRITGSGDDEFDYGFRIRASRDGPDYSASCIVAAGMSTNYEIDHIEAYECGFAGVSAKTDPTCDDRDLSGFVQRDSSLHHLYLHDTGGEGIYFGSTGFPSRTGNCDGTEVDLIPHSHEGVYIHDNIIEDTGWDGAQVGVSPKDCYVYRNRIARVGLEMEQYQMQGLQIGGGSSCEVFDNFIAHGPAIGLIVLDAADMWIANNVFLDFVDGIYINDRDSEVSEGAQYIVAHNTVVSASDRGVTLFGERSSGSLVLNNLVVATGNSPLGFAVDGTEDGNLLLDSIAEAGFVDAAGEDFMLSEGSPAIDAGVDARAARVETDQRSAPRDAAPDAGAFEFGAEPPDEPASPPGPGSSMGGGGTSGPPSSPDDPDEDGEDGDSNGKESSDEGGCGCKTAGRGAPLRAPLLGMTICLLALVLRRRSSKITS